MKRRKHIHEGELQDLHVEPETAVLYIEHVPFVAMDHIIQVVGSAAAAFYLGHAGNARLYKLACVIMLDDLGKFPAIADHMRTGAYNAHRTKKYIDKLRELIEARQPEEFSQTGNAGIILLRLPDIGFA